MSRQFIKYIPVLALLLACFCFKANAQNVLIEAKLDQSTIKIGEQTQLRFIVQQSAKNKVNFPQLVDSVVSKVLIVGAPKRDTILDKNDPEKATITQTYTITGFDAGTYVIPPLSFGSGTGVAKSNELTLYVQTVKVDTTKAIFDIKQPLVVTYTFGDWLRDNWVWVVLGVVIILAIAGIIWYLKKRPKKVVVVEEVKPDVPPHTIALGKLQQLRDKKLWQQDEVKLYYSELSDVVREYLEKRYVIKTQEKTTDEIFAGLKHMDITEENRNKLRQILLLADLVKFAKEKPLPHENEQSIDNAVSFVMSAQQVFVPVNKNEGGAADGHA